jgi:hypothetical protein
LTIIEKKFVAELGTVFDHGLVYRHRNKCLGGGKGKEENEAGSEGVVCFDRHHGEHGGDRAGPGNVSVS